MHAFINTLCYNKAFTCTHKLNWHKHCSLQSCFYGMRFRSWFLQQLQRNAISTEGDHNNPPPMRTWGPESICYSGGTETLAAPVGIPIIYNLMNSIKSVYMWFIESHSTHYIHTIYKGCWLTGTQNSTWVMSQFLVI